MAEAAEAKGPAPARLASYLPAITGVAIFVLSIFNIGYFSKIGLHFLGVMDLSNFVYSLSFIIAILTGSLGVYFWGDYLERLMANVGDARGRKRIIWSIVGFFSFVLVLTIVIHWFFPQLVAKYTPVDRPVAIVAVVMAAVILAVEHSDFRKAGRIPIGSGFYAFVLTVLALYYVGRAVAEHEIYTTKTTYNFIVKDGPPVIGKILRASSSGFIIFADERVMFLPQGEIKQVKASDELKF